MAKTHVVYIVKENDKLYACDATIENGFDVLSLLLSDSFHFRAVEKHNSFVLTIQSEKKKNFCLTAGMKYMIR